MNKELISDLRLGASISRDRNLNLDYAKIADKAADTIEAQDKRIAELEEFEKVLRQIADMKRKTREQRLASACLHFLESMK